MNFLQYIAAIIVIFEALNKLERCNIFGTDMTPRQRVSDALKAVAWGMMALGTVAIILGPLAGYAASTSTLGLLHHIADTFGVVGFAILIVRTRVKEVQDRDQLQTH